MTEFWHKVAFVHLFYMTIITSSEKFIPAWLILKIFIGNAGLNI